MSSCKGIPRLWRAVRSWVCSFGGSWSRLLGVVTGVATAVIGLIGCDCFE